MQPPSSSAKYCGMYRYSIVDDKWTTVLVVSSQCLTSDLHGLQLAAEHSTRFARGGHSMLKIGSRLYILGGQRHRNLCSDLLYYDIDSAK
jgi:hypothetical protein